MTVVQRFGGSLNLHVHLDVLALDGVYEEGAGASLRWVAARPPPPGSGYYGDYFGGAFLPAAPQGQAGPVAYVFSWMQPVRVFRLNAPPAMTTGLGYSSLTVFR